MAKVKVTADEFIKNNGLFKVLEHSDGELNKSYRTISQEYIMECTKCGQQVQQRGKAPFECKRCRRSVSPILNAQGKNSWVIDESKINNKNALDAMKIPAKNFGNRRMVKLNLKKLNLKLRKLMKVMKMKMLFKILLPLKNLLMGMVCSKF
jgi:hypothetical protein